MKNDNQPDLLLKDECYKIVGACMAVHRELGCGFLEAVYHQALAIEFDILGIPFQREVEISNKYKERILDKFYKADFICYDSFILELKALSMFSIEQASQVINYLKATGYRVGILVNFGATSLEYKRIIV